MARVVEKTARGRRTCGECRKDRASHEDGSLGHAFEARYQCEKCRRAIEPGEKYLEVRQKRQRGGITRRRCSDCPRWKASELTTSEFLATLYAASEDEPAVNVDPDDEDATRADLEALRDHYVDACRAAAQIRWDAADAMEDGFGHETETSQALRDVGDEVDGIADEIEGVDLDDFDPEDDEAEFESWAEDKVQEIQDLFSTAEGA